ncbi:MAG: HNH endonuclease [Bacteroidota bacterium]|nr:HNH endonuclease [Bacteroidota bacterium]
MEVISSDYCALCGRELADPCNRHHLVPLSKGGRGSTTILLHKICHDKIHAVFTEMELKRYYHTIERLQQHGAIANFMRWIRNKEPSFYDRSVKMKR